MANTNDVKKYLASWFQLAKGVIVTNGKEILLPCPIFEGDDYSKEFQKCWEKITSPSSGDCYLEGTETTISQLLTPVWEINSCARCQMPVPIRNYTVSEIDCTCSDLENWPNEDLPTPRSQMNSLNKLREINYRLQQMTTEKA
ncbi:MAG: hypothetical protein AAF378_15620 [Cyanobacteria bacterium P01_A01_bin.84]